jgi:predicted permease
MRSSTHPLANKRKWIADRQLPFFPTAMSLMREIAQSTRSLLKSPSLPAIAILSLGLGVGVNTTLFSVFKSVFLDDISAVQPSRLVRAWVGGTNRLSYANFRDLEDARVFQGWAGYSLASLNYGTHQGAEKLWGQMVTGNYFDVLGLKAAVGRTFTAAESQPERDPRAVVISHSFWQQRLHGDPSVVGRELRLNDQTFTIVGVLPESHRGVLGFGFAPRVYVPFSTTLQRDLLDRSRTATLEAFGRLAAGVNETQARTALLARAQELKRTFPTENRRLDEVQFFAMSGWGRVSAKGFPIPILVFFVALLAVSGMVLLIACANIAGLLLARGMNRQRDTAVRLALGASRADILRHLLAESFVLACLGTAAGLLVAVWAGSALPSISLPISYPVELRVATDWRLLAYAAGLAFLSTLACGLTPGWQAMKTTVSAGFGDRSATAGQARVSLRNALVVGQVAASFALLVVAAMFLRSLQHVSTVRPGFEVERIVNVKLGPDQKADEAMQVLARVPGVESVSGAMLTPLSGDGWITEAELESGRVVVHANSVLEGYFDTMRIPLVEGREFLATDRDGAAAVGMVNQTFARRHFAASGAVGKRLRILGGANESQEFQIVGVVADSKYNTLGEDPRLLVYRPFRQASMGGLTLHLRTAGPPAAVTPSLRTAMLEMDRNAPVEVQPMTDTLAFALMPSRMAAILLGAMGTLGLVLALIGLYGTLAYAVSKRTAELGIRLALGASRGAVLGLVLRDGALLVGAGLIGGAAVAAAASIPLAQFVAGASVTDLETLGPVAVVMVLVGMAACAIPARRAARVDPMVALRYE